MVHEFIILVYSLYTGLLALVEKRDFIRPFSPQIIRPMTNGHISLGSIENMGQGTLVPVQMCALVPV
jgi:hypothetical protein